MADYPETITFFEWLAPKIIAGDKHITIRNYAESHYRPGSRVTAYTLETHQRIADIEILAVEPLFIEDINQQHAEQEGLALEQLQGLIRRIYPDQQQLYVISFRLLPEITAATESTAAPVDTP
ncbi:ASCH domain-containing protein [Shewanella avicenniae]|uniref:ASCH domain-containing protein n=1 Tax=Shewanella avicenniae TaxID=2814294 RepID=A0ABX7QR92_9GAMM|nr:N(4)-acetylcytidine aminohydrolase [Shewanella avicenniae]QSX33547.1 ASCH domain-containing protein [Shewanella avicenniae]